MTPPAAFDRRFLGRLGVDVLEPSDALDRLPSRRRRAIGVGSAVLQTAAILVLDAHTAPLWDPHDTAHGLLLIGLFVAGVVAASRPGSHLIRHSRSFVASQHTGGRARMGLLLVAIPGAAAATAGRDPVLGPIATVVLALALFLWGAASSESANRVAAAEERVRAGAARAFGIPAGDVGLGWTGDLEDAEFRVRLPYSVPARSFDDLKLCLEAELPGFRIRGMWGDGVIIGVDEAESSARPSWSAVCARSGAKPDPRDSGRRRTLA